MNDLDDYSDYSEVPGGEGLPKMIHEARWRKSGVTQRTVSDVEYAAPMGGSLLDMLEELALGFFFWSDDLWLFFSRGFLGRSQFLFQHLDTVSKLVNGFTLDPDLILQFLNYELRFHHSDSLG
jgi:hypothetical protein